MSSTVIRDFLVALTFKTDDTGAKKSKEALDSNEKSAKILSQTLISLASIAVIAIAKTANELEKLFYSSQRIGASANNIRAYGDAISQMGGSAEGAISSLESVARKLRESPGYEGMLKGLGVTTRDQNGQMRDRVEVMKDLSKTLQGMEYYKANNYANTLKDLQQKATDFILGKKIGDETLGIKLGRTVAKGLAFIGNEEAQAALDAEKASTGNTKQQSTKTLQQTALALSNALVPSAHAETTGVKEKIS